MKRFLVLFREPDGRTIPHSQADILKHREDWRKWLSLLTSKGIGVDGNALTLNGIQIEPEQNGNIVKNGIYYVNGLEIVGGFLILKANNLTEVTEFMLSCPAFDFDSKAEIREIMD